MNGSDDVIETTKKILAKLPAIPPPLDIVKLGTT